MSLSRPPKLPLPIQSGIGVPLFALAAFWWYTYSGPYRWLADWQIREQGTFYPTYTFVAVFLIPLVLAAILIQVGCWLAGVRFDAEKTEASIEQWKTWHQDRQYRIMALAVGSVVLALGGYSLYVGTNAGPRTSLSVAALENGSMPPSRWLALSGTLRKEDQVSWKVKNKVEIYVPLVSENWQPGKPIAVLVRAKEGEDGSPERLLRSDEGMVEGLVDPLGLPGHVRTTLTDNGVITAAEPVVLDYRSDPRVQVVLGWMGVALGGTLILGSTLVWLIKGR